MPLNRKLQLQAMIVPSKPPSMSRQSSPLPEENNSLAGSSEGQESPEQVLCQHCRRTASNGIRCLGMCVADSDY